MLEMNLLDKIIHKIFSKTGMKHYMISLIYLFIFLNMTFLMCLKFPALKKRNS